MPPRDEILIRLFGGLYVAFIFGVALAVCYAILSL